MNVSLLVALPYLEPGSRLLVAQDDSVGTIACEARESSKDDSTKCGNEYKSVPHKNFYFNEIYVLYVLDIDSLSGKALLEKGS